MKVKLDCNTSHNDYNSLEILPNSWPQEIKIL